MFQGFDRNLMVFPVKAFEGIYQSISSQNLADPQVRMLLRLILGSAHKFDMNEQGNVTVPQVLKEYASLKVEAPISIHFEYDLGGAEGGKKTTTMAHEKIYELMKSDLDWFHKSLVKNQIEA